MKHAYAAVAAAVILSTLHGCAGSPARLAMMSKDELAQQSNESLCNAYENWGNKDARAILESRNVLSATDWDNIDKKNIAIGMSRLGLICLKGVPAGGQLGHINSTTTANGVHEQWVYDEFSSPRYVYIDQGVVSGWQN